MNTSLVDSSIPFDQLSARLIVPLPILVIILMMLAASSIFTIMTSFISSFAIFSDKELYQKTENPFLVSLVVSDGMLSVGWSSFVAIYVLCGRDQPVEPTTIIRMWELFRYYRFTSTLSALYITLNRLLLITRPYPTYLYDFKVDVMSSS